ncbi:MAG: hypothetical protein PWP23_1858 [Candidatus Sumerlaeota bacterium]|nr:hypothetical protein [Candidatus Sumerlaeota bacterium]
MTHAPRHQLPPHPDPTGRAEETFLSLARTPEFMDYLGRMADATDEELRSLFGVAMAALRQSRRASFSPPSSSRPHGGEAPRVSPEVLESRIAQLTSALNQRDEHIRALKRELESRHKAG